MCRFLIFGNGWLGNKFNNYLDDAILVKERINSIKDIEKQIIKNNPKIVINAIGKTGRPNIDWCELHKDETFFSNVTIPTLMEEVCTNTDIYMVHIGSGCIYQSNNNEIWSENDKPNFKGSFYSRTKIFSEKILSEYDNVLIIRIRMPIDNIPSPRNLIDKLVGYEKVIGDIPNSVTYIPDLMTIAKTLMDRKDTGIFNVSNKGAITYREILEMYKNIVDPLYELPIFIGLEELKNLIVAGRSNCILNIDKLSQKGIQVRNTEEALKECFQEYKRYI